MRQLLKRNNIYKWLNLKQFISMSCLLCRADTPMNQPVCGLCMKSLPVAEQHCQSCGIPVPLNALELCARCLQKKPVFDTCYSAFNYEFPVDHLLKQIKYHQQLIYLPPVADQLTRNLIHHYDGREWPQAILPVPLHNKRLRTRGFDQALLLARQLVKNLQPYQKIKLEAHLIKRQKHTIPQQGLKASKRRSNIRNAFSMTDKSNYQYLAIVDDVVTTGETVTEIARLLKKQGVERVDIWCLARTPDYRQDL
ncbi:MULTISPECIES: ComF family protein [unclassified Endozoicomonas]|uniref:ComF family protein n=2 Tax=unclassified Endozoicomonas TaxID=2644528 RepID=UPI003BB774C9